MTATSDVRGNAVDAQVGQGEQWKRRGQRDRDPVRNDEPAQVGDDRVGHAEDVDDLCQDHESCCCHALSSGVIASTAID